MGRTPKKSKTQHALWEHCLKGVKVSCTGLNPQHKDKLHVMAVKLGGIYTATLSTSDNTHLIAGATTGEKYDEAMKSSNPIFIITPEWLEDCFSKKSRLDEKLYEVDEEDEDNSEEDGDDDTDGESDSSFRFLAAQAPSSASELFQKKMDEALAIPMSLLFANCKFYFANVPADSSFGRQLSKLVRLGSGTRYWYVNEVVTHVVVQSVEGEDNTRIEKLFRLHPNGPLVVTPDYIIQSLIMHKLENGERYKVKKPKRKNIATKESQGQGPEVQRSKDAMEKISPNSASVQVTQANKKRGPEDTGAGGQLSSSSCKKLRKSKLPKTLSSDIIIAITGIVCDERVKIGKAITDAGATYTPHLGKSNTHLICGKNSGQKYEKALEWKLTIVDKDWIFEDAEEGESPPPVDYRKGLKQLEKGAGPTSSGTKSKAVAPRRLSRGSVLKDSSRRLRRGSDGGDGGFMPPPPPPNSVDVDERLGNEDSQFVFWGSGFG